MKAVIKIISCLFILSLFLCASVCSAAADDTAASHLDDPIGLLGGEWDESTEFHTCQTDTMDLISAAMIQIPTKRMFIKFGSSVPEALKSSTGLDHLDIDASFTTDTNDGFIPEEGSVSVRDVYHLYRFQNTLYVLPMSGRDIENILEENASRRLFARLIHGRPHYYTSGDQSSCLIPGGINFLYDMSKPEGERVIIDSFASGRAFDPNGIYLVSVPNDILGNNKCGLRIFSSDDAVWSHQKDEENGTIPAMIIEYIHDKTQTAGAVTPEDFNWQWCMTWSGDPSAILPYDGKIAATLTDIPRAGHVYVLCEEANGITFSYRQDNSGFSAASVKAYTDNLVDDLPADALFFTVEPAEDNTFRIVDLQGRPLSCGRNRGLFFADESEKDSFSRWKLIPADGGWYLVTAGTPNQAIGYCSEHFIACSLKQTGSFVFNFYEISPEFVSCATYIPRLIMSFGKGDPDTESLSSQLLFRIKSLNPDLGFRWEEILDLWKKLNSDFAVNLDVLPDGLPDTEELCIVVLGYQLNPDGSMKPELYERLKTALRSAKKYPNALIACTGGRTASKNSDVSEAGCMAEWLIDNGISPSRILVEDASLSTSQNALFTLDLLADKAPQVHQLAIVTSDYHIPAGILLFDARSILIADDPSQRIRVVAHAAWDSPTGTYTIPYQSFGLLDIASHP